MFPLTCLYSVFAMIWCVFTGIMHRPFALVSAALYDFRSKTLFAITGTTAAYFVVGAAVHYRMNEERPILLYFL